MKIFVYLNYEYDFFVPERYTSGSVSVVRFNKIELEKFKDYGGFKEYFKSKIKALEEEKEHERITRSNALKENRYKTPQFIVPICALVISLAFNVHQVVLNKDVSILKGKLRKAELMNDSLSLNLQKKETFLVEVLDQIESLKDSLGSKTKNKISGK